MVIASGDGIYKLDYGKVLEYHIDKKADITIVCKEMAAGTDMSRFGAVKADDTGRVIDFEEKPMATDAHMVSCGIYIIRRRQLIELIEKCAEEIRKGSYPRNGLHLYNRIAGLLCQRLWYYGKTKSYSDRLKISNACTGCGLCARLCPADNLTLKNGKAAAGKHCTMCYRCISSCPARAITLLGHTVIEQCRYDKYIQN